MLNQMSETHRLHVPLPHLPCVSDAKQNFSAAIRTPPKVLSAAVLTPLLLSQSLPLTLAT